MVASEPNEWLSEIFFAFASSSAVAPFCWKSGDDLQNRSLRFSTMHWIKGRVDPKHPRIARRIGKGGYSIDKARLLRAPCDKAGNCGRRRE